MNPWNKTPFLAVVAAALLSTACIAEGDGSDESVAGPDPEEPATTEAVQRICGPTTTRPADVLTAMQRALGIYPGPNLNPGAHGTGTTIQPAPGPHGMPYGGLSGSSPYNGPFGAFSLIPAAHGPATGGCGP